MESLISEIRINSDLSNPTKTLTFHKDKENQWSHYEVLGHLGLVAYPYERIFGGNEIVVAEIRKTKDKWNLESNLLISRCLSYGDLEIKSKLYDRMIKWINRYGIFESNKCVELLKQLEI